MSRRITAAACALAVVVFAAAVITFGPFGKFSVKDPVFSWKAGPAMRMAPDFVLLHAVENTPVHLHEWLDERPVLLVFWATWCPPCVAEIPKLQGWHEDKFEEFRILAIHVGSSNEPLDSFIKRQGITYPVLHDSESKVAAQYGVVGLPVAVMLDKEGEILYYGLSLPEPESILAEAEHES